MPQTIELIGRHPITIDSAIDEEVNVINWASYGPATEQLYQYLWQQRDSISALVKHHLGLGNQDKCCVLPQQQWTRGSFNVCVFVRVTHGDASKKIIFRYPMPHKLAEAHYPGSVDEKLGCEVGASIWVEEMCPEIRSPRLYGFGFSDGRQFTHMTNLSLLPRTLRQLRRSISKLFRQSLVSRYVQDLSIHRLPSAYMVLEYLGPEIGQVLSDTFHTGREDYSQRSRLFRGISRILLSLARIPQARIGSFCFNYDGTVELTNRPLSCSMMISENEGAPRIMQRRCTYSCADAFVSDTLSFHDQRFLHQPNAVYNDRDCRGQMAVKMLLRSSSHNYIKRENRTGPFILQLTDFHASNILVDRQWNITGLIDLEWICSLPAEMLDVPYWLTGCSVDQIKNEKLDQFDQARQEFMCIFREEETKVVAKHSITLSSIMQEMWESKGVWFWHCISSVNAMYLLLPAHLYPPKLLSLDAEKILSTLWCKDSEDIVQRKLAEKEAYDDEVRALFQDNVDVSGG